MSSPYVVLKNRPLDQWKVTELKEELKKRKLTIKGLKEDLVKRLDEAVRAEWETARESTDKNLNEEHESEIPSEQEIPCPIVSERAKDLMDKGSDTIGTFDRVADVNVEDGGGSLAEGGATTVDTEDINGVGLDGERADQFTTVETTVVVHETIESVTTFSGSDLPKISDAIIHLPKLKESSMSVCPSGGLSLQDSQIENEAMHSSVDLHNDDPKCLRPEHNVQPLDYQVSGVDHPDLESQVISDPVSTESVSIIDINEVKVDTIIDNSKLELNVDCENVHSPPSSFTHPLNVEDKIYKEETGASKIENTDILKIIDYDDMGPEKLSLDRSSGDDSMEDDALQSKQMEYKPDSLQARGGVGKTDLIDNEEDKIVDVVGGDKLDETNIVEAENSMDSSLISMKRKASGNDEEVVGNNDASKRPHRLNAEGFKVSEYQSSTFTTPRTPKYSFQDPQISVSRLNKLYSELEEVPKERLVPPSSKPPSNSLRIDRFLRPFTLKAVQELLGKTGTITSFWMDHIKTHCYLSYSSVEEAVETRNAVYNLQWPPNGGHLLVAEFVEPEDVKTRIEAPAASLVSPSSGSIPHFSTAQPTMQTQPSPWLQFPRKQPPPPSLPIPPLTHVPPVRDRTHPALEPLPREQLLSAKDQLNLPPAPPLPEKVDPPIVTLDDLFRKTNATPRIYYLPLSQEQVSTKLKAQGKNA